MSLLLSWVRLVLEMVVLVFNIKSGSVVKWRVVVWKVDKRGLIMGGWKCLGGREFGGG